MARWAIIFVVAMSGFLSLGQTRPRDYVISLPRVSFSADGRVAIVSFTVSNQGGDAIDASQVLIRESLESSVEVSADLPALASGGEQNYRIELRLAELPEADLHFEVEAGIDAYELAGSDIARNNKQIFRINQADIGNAPVDEGIATHEYDLLLPVLNLGIDILPDGIALNGQAFRLGDLLRLAGLTLLALFCLWLLSLALRLILRGTPKYASWQPPYAVSAWHDPNSALGRRQSWQFHAQNGRLDAPRMPDQVAVIKRLTDEAGQRLGGWSFKAMRTAQYDIYGRINRTEVVMPHKISQQLTRIAKRAPGMNDEQLNKALRMPARRIARQALSAIEKQNRMLPLALDMRFEGEKDAALVIFELYQFRDGAWRMIDQWEPELGMLGARIPEQYSFSLNGQLPGESYREYKTRLRDDLTGLLKSLISPEPADAGSQAMRPANDERPGSQDDPPAAEPDDETKAG